jgi:hypothetical protein
LRYSSISAAYKAGKRSPNLRKLYDPDLLTVPWKEKEGNLE